MRAIDTNVLVRLIARDDAAQTSLAEAFVAKGAFVPLLALVETAWVLDAVYERTAEQIALCLDMLLSHEQLVLERGEIVEAALNQFRAKPKVGFSDCLMLEVARAAGHIPFGTFDKALSKRDGAALLA
jgi:predicted nucleic-acid-binding protein